MAALLTAGECWDLDPPDEIDVGDFFVAVPSLWTEVSPITADDEWGVPRAYLPTGMSPGVLFRIYAHAWWFLPLATPAQFEGQTTHDALLEEALAGAVVDWFPVPVPEVPASQLSTPGLIYLRLPTVLRPELVAELQLQRVARLTEAAFESLCEHFHRAVELR